MKDVVQHPGSENPTRLSLTTLPLEVLLSIVNDTNILTLRDKYNLLLTNKHISRCLRSCLFRKLTLGVADPCPEIEVITSENLEVEQTVGACVSRRLALFVQAIGKGYIVEEDIADVRYLTIHNSKILPSLLEKTKIEECTDLNSSRRYSSENYRETVMGKAIEFLLRNLTGLKQLDMTVFTKVTETMVPAESLNQLIVGTHHVAHDWLFLMLKNGVFDIIPGQQVKLSIATNIAECLQLMRDSTHYKEKFKIVKLNVIDPVTGNEHSNDERREKEKAILKCIDVEELHLTNMVPWSEATAKWQIETMAIGRPTLSTSPTNNDLPNLKILHMNSAPNFTSLPESLLELYIDIGPEDVINHHCWPIFCSLPNLQVFHVLNRQIRLPQYSHVPTAQPPANFTAFSQLRSLIVGIPRPQEKVYFIAPGALAAIVMCNPHLEHIYYSCISGGDLKALAQASCHTVLKTLEIQSDVFQSTPGEPGFVTSDLVELFEHGLPNLESLKWACNNNQKMALSVDLAKALFPKSSAVENDAASSSQRKHNLRVLAIESRVAPPRRTLRLHGMVKMPVAWETIVEKRQQLKISCTDVSLTLEGDELISKKGQFDDCIKDVIVQTSGQPTHITTADNGTLSEKMYVIHQGLGLEERRLLATWREGGGCSWEIEWAGANIGMVNSLRALWEELFFVDLEKLRDFAYNT